MPQQSVAKARDGGKDVKGRSGQLKEQQRETIRDELATDPQEQLLMALAQAA